MSTHNPPAPVNIQTFTPLVHGGYQRRLTILIPTIPTKKETRTIKDILKEKYTVFSFDQTSFIFISLFYTLLCSALIFGCHNFSMDGFVKDVTVEPFWKVIKGRYLIDFDFVCLGQCLLTTVKISIFTINVKLKVETFPYKDVFWSYHVFMKIIVYRKRYKLIYIILSLVLIRISCKA